MESAVHVAVGVGGGAGVAASADVPVEATIQVGAGETFERSRHVRLENTTATAPGTSLAGVNVNYGDTATFAGITIVGDPERDVCTWYEGVTDGEPAEIGGGPIEQCRYDPAAIRYEQPERVPPLVDVFPGQQL